MDSINFWLRAGGNYFPALRLQRQFHKFWTDVEGEGRKIIDTCSEPEVDITCF